MAGRPRKENALDKVDIEELERKFRELGSVKKVAELYGVTPADVYSFRSRHSSELKKIKKKLNKEEAELEQGLIIDTSNDDEPVNKIATASKLEVKIDITDMPEFKEKVEEFKRLKEELESELKNSKETIDNQADQIKQLNEKAVKDNEEIKSMKERVADVEAKGIDAIQKDKEMRNKLKSEITDLKSQLSNHKETIRKAGKTNEILSEELDKRIEYIKKIESEAEGHETKVAEMVVSYESHIKALQTEIDELNSRLPEQVRVVQNDELTDDSQYIMRDVNDAKDNSDTVTEIKYDIINKPAHYNFGDIEVVDFIEQVADQYPGKVAYHIGNNLKYVSRAPFKNGVEDLKKAEYSIKRAIKNWEDVKGE